MADVDNLPNLRPARLDELNALSDLCLRSKAVWGYDAAFLEACRAELSLHEKDLDDLCVADRGGAILGIAQVSVSGKVASLDKLFIDPDAMKCGVGRRLFDWAARTARARGAIELVIESDPDAAGFYRRMGARDDGFAASGSIPGRMLPRLKIALDRD